MKRYFENRKQIEEYKKYRTELPVEIVRRIITFLGETFDVARCIGVDVGCGSGQSTRPFACLLEKLFGIDISFEQIAAVENDKISNVEFKVGSCYNIPMADNSVQLVTAVNSAHWFELDRFYKEVNRILVPQGVLALVRGSSMFEIVGCEEQSVNLYLKLREKTMPYWDESCESPDPLYKNINMPYRMNVRDESVIIESEMTISSIVNRVRTDSGIAKFLIEDPDNANKVLKEFESNLLNAVGCFDAVPETTRVIVRQPFILLMGRKP